MSNTILIGSKSFGTSSEAIMQLDGWNVIYQSKTHECEIPYAKITGIIAGTEVYDDIKLSRMPNLKVISRMGVGYDDIDLEYCAADGITVTYSPYGPTQSVAEMTLGFIIMLLRNIHQANSNTHNKNWKKLMGRQFSEVNIGILGMGRIGSTVYRLLKPFNPKQIYVCDTDQAVRNDFEGFGFDLKWVNIDELFTKSDLVSLHIPIGPFGNYQIINDRLLRHTPPGNMIVNTSRGKLIESNSLYSALQENRLKGAALDVFDHEPYTGELLAFDNVIATPHISSMTRAARHKMENDAVTDCIRVLENKKPIFEVPHDSNL